MNSTITFDAVAVLPGAAAVLELLADPVAIAWVVDAFVHCKVIATIGDAGPLLAAARVAPDAGVVDLGGDRGIERFVTTARGGRIWSREPAAQAVIAPPQQQPAAMPPVATPDRSSPRNSKH